MEKELILAINPGSTSTKLGVYRVTEQIARKQVDYTAAELAPYKTISAQLELRARTVEEFLSTLEPYGSLLRRWGGAG